MRIIKTTKYFNNNIFGLFKKIIAGLFLLIFTSSCLKDFLNVMPDNVSTIEHAFKNKFEAEKYLHTCYSFMPSTDRVSNILHFGADDMWTWYNNHYSYQSPWKIAMGEQNVVSPLVNAWNGENHSKNMYQAIRDCNIFIENIEDRSKVLDLEPSMRVRWIAEAKFLKAYYHFYLFRMYGPIPVVKVNLPVSASQEEVKVYRNTVDEVVEYMVELLDESMIALPATIENQSGEAGRVTKQAALMLKAKILVTAASPLFNGNNNYASFKDKRGIALFSSNYDHQKWEKAVVACEEAIDGMSGIALYTYNSNLVNVSTKTKLQMNIRGAVTERFNSELIWGRMFNTNQIQEGAWITGLDPKSPTAPWSSSYYSVTMNMVERFYTKNGVPIQDDKTWDYPGRFRLQKADANHKYEVQENFTTAKINFDREPRYYGSLAFDGGVWFMNNNGTDNNAFRVNVKFGQPQGKTKQEYYNETGYWPKKLVNSKFEIVGNDFVTERYPWPEMRLADLYLLYAEALNEVDRRDDAIYYLDLIRQRSGLKGVKESWDTYTNRGPIYNNKDGLREIIQQEREIELAFEGSRLWDMRRWKTAEIMMNKPVQGWDIQGKEDSEYYRVRTLFNLQFISPRDYFWPIKEEELLRNPNLVQNPGW